jgi:MinD-like ATPase involved in chromosome partitioning or flagellar assembly
MVLVVNKCPAVFDATEVRERVEQTYDCEVAGVLPHSDEVMILSSGGIFAIQYPDHPVTALYRGLANSLLD